MRTRVIKDASNLNVKFWIFPNFEDRLIPNFESIKMFGTFSGDITKRCYSSILDICAHLTIMFEEINIVNKRVNNFVNYSYNKI